MSAQRARYWLGWCDACTGVFALVLAGFIWALKIDAPWVAVSLLVCAHCLVRALQWFNDKARRAMREARLRGEQ